MEWWEIVNLLLSFQIDEIFACAIHVIRVLLSFSSSLLLHEIEQSGIINI